MARRRVQILVEMDLDPVPGAYHEPEDALERVLRDLEWRTPHYHPTAELVKVLPASADCCGATEREEDGLIIHPPTCSTWDLRI